MQVAHAAGEGLVALEEKRRLAPLWLLLLLRGGGEDDDDDGAPSSAGIREAERTVRWSRNMVSMKSCVDIALAP